MYSKRIGIVTNIKPFRIKWWGDEKDFQPDLERSPKEITTFKLDDWFDAETEIEKGILQEITSVSLLPIEPEKQYDDEALARELEELGTISIDDI